MMYNVGINIRLIMGECGWDVWIRTTIARSKFSSPTIGRRPKFYFLKFDPEQVRQSSVADEAKNLFLNN